MLLFIVITFALNHSPALFQYIPCYCLSVKPYYGRYILSHFNTSHVTVYLCNTGFFNGCKRISIHPMLLFISAHPSILDLRLQISIHPMLLFIVEEQHHGVRTVDFNKSHVTVYLEQRRKPRRKNHNFNTSHVTVYLGTMFVGNNEFGNFNTSHVTVYP